MSKTRNLNNRFKRLQNDNLSSFINFGRSVIYQNFSYQTISKWFKKLVDKEDYDKKDKEGIITHFHDLTILKMV